MSLSVLSSLGTVATVPYQIDYSQGNLENDISVLIGPNNITYPIQKPNGNATSDSEINFNIYSPNRNSTSLNKSVLLRGTFEVTINIPDGLTKGTPSFDEIVEGIMDGNFALAANPFYSSLNNITLSFDSKSVTETVSEYSRFIKYINYDEEGLKMWDSYTPNLLDNSFFFTSKQKNSVLNGGDDIAIDGIRPRGAYSYYDFRINSTNRTFSFKLDVTEPLNLSPFMQTFNINSNDSGFIGFSNLKVSLNFKSPQQMFDSCVCINPFLAKIPEIVSTKADPVVYTFPTLSPSFKASTSVLESFFTGTCKITNIDLVCKFDTLPMTMLSPETVNYSYNKIQYLPEDISGTIEPATYKVGNAQTASSIKPSSNTVSLNSYNLSAVPNKVMIGIIPTSVNGIISGTQTEIPTSQRCTAFLPIYHVDVMFNNQSGILSNCTPQHLYHKSVENGLRWIDWTNSGMGGHYIKKNSGNFGFPLGAPLVLAFGTDIHYGEGIAPGLVINGTIQYKLSFYNYLNQSVKARAVVLYFYEGVFVLSNVGQCTFQESLLTMTDIMNVDKENIISTNDLRAELQFSGGSFWSGLKKIGKKTMKIVKSKPFRKALQVIGQDLDIPGVSAAARIADRELGSGGRLLNSNSNGGRLMSRNDTGSAMVAGAKSINASQLRNRLMK